MEISYKNKYKHYTDRINDSVSEFIFGGYFVALSGPVYVFIASLLLNITVDLPLLLIAYLPPLIVYSFNFYSEISGDERSNPERARYLASKQKNFPATIATYVILLTILLIICGNLAMFTFIGTLALLGILYTALFKGLTGKIPLLKSVFVSFVWAAGGSFLILFYFSLRLNVFFVLFFLFIFLQDIANVIFFDIKDYEADKKRGLKTLPVMWGRSNTLTFLYALNIIGLLPVLLGVYFKVFPAFSLFILLVFVYKLFYLDRARHSENENLRFLSYTLVEAEFIFLPVLLIAGIAVTGMF